jgi:superfamily II DNA or RNA helicase
MNSSISKYGFGIEKNSVSLEEIVNLKKILKAKPIVSESFGVVNNNFNVFIETPTKLFIPKMFAFSYFSKTTTRKFKNYFGKDWDTDIPFAGTLLETQIEPAALLYSACKEKGGGVLDVLTGGGKTTMALYVASQLKKKSIIVVNKVNLMRQWEKEIKKFLPNARVGIIQGQKMDVNDKDIVIAMLQSVSRIDYPESIFSEFGTVIVDEVHNTCSKSFSQLFFKLCCQYSIGLSATPKRADGCEYVFKWHIGNIIDSCKIKRKGNEPILRLVTLKSDDYREIKLYNHYMQRESIQFTSMLSDLILMPERNEYICKLIQQLQLEKRKILVMSDRRAHLQILYKLLQRGDENNVGLFMGSMKAKDLDDSIKCQVILATFSAFAEGISVADLDTLVLVTPKKYIKNEKQGYRKDSGKMRQIIGRIFRKEHVNTVPLIVDLCDDFSIYKSHSTSRKAFYKQELGVHTLEKESVEL